MRRDNNELIALAAIGFIPLIWFALIIAPYASGGIRDIALNLSDIFSDPTKITWTGDSLKTILFFIVLYAFAIGICLSLRKNYRRGEEHGSAKWGNPARVCKKYMEKKYENNKILTQNVRIGLDGRKHRRRNGSRPCRGGSVLPRAGVFC